MNLHSVSASGDFTLTGLYKEILLGFCIVKRGSASKLVILNVLIKNNSLYFLNL